MGNNECCHQILSEITKDIRLPSHHYVSHRPVQSTDPSVASKSTQHNTNPADKNHIAHNKRYKSPYKLRDSFELKDELKGIKLKQEDHASRQENGSDDDMSTPIGPMSIRLPTDVHVPHQLSPLVKPLPPVSADDLYSFSDVLTLSPSLPLHDIKEEDTFVLDGDVPVSL
eukprot:275331_1